MHWIRAALYANPSVNGNGQPTQDIATKAIILQPNTIIDANSVGTYLAQIGTGSISGTVQGLQTIDYQYHIRGYLKSVNDGQLNNNQNDFFGHKLEFEDDGTYFDGNIRKEIWKSQRNTGSIRSYTYNYDAAQRLLNATYGGGQFSGENFGFSVSGYDKNGNILSLTRTGATALNNGTPTQFGTIDQMSYLYEGNRLTGISDAVNGNVDVGDFRDNGNSSDYTYWPDGSLKSDGNRGINQINWDSFLNKPSEINYADGRWIRFYYDGSGKKLQESTSTGDQTDYTNGAIYKNGQLYQISQPEGRIVPNGSGGLKHQFDYKDHLGNLRLVFEGEGTATNGVYPAPVIVQENAYYPFGLAHTGTDYQQNSPNNYQYNGKEKLNAFGLNYSDYGFRNVDLLTARFISVDPLADKFPELTTFQYASNNPILNIDLDGLEGINSLIYNNAVENGKLSRQERQNRDINVVKSVLSLTDANDATVLATTLTRGADAINLDGSPATTSDKFFAAAGSLIPAVSGSAIKKGLNAIGDKIDDIVEIFIDSQKHPASAKHLDEAISAGKSNEGVIDRAGASNRRKENLRGKETEKGKDRDEAPPAVIDTGEKASVKSIPSSDNRGAGGSIGRQMSMLPDGQKVRIVTKND